YRGRPVEPPLPQKRRRRASRPCAGTQPYRPPSRDRPTLTGSAKKDALRRCITTRAIGTCECVVISLDTLISRRCKRKFAAPWVFLKKCHPSSDRALAQLLVASASAGKSPKLCRCAAGKAAARLDGEYGSSLVDGDSLGRGQQKGTLCRYALLRRLEDELQHVRIPQPGDGRHHVELAIPAPARVRVDLEQLDLTLAIGTEIEAGVVAAAQPLEQDVRIVDQLAPGILVELGFAVLDLRPIGRIGDPFRLISQELWQVAVESGVVDLERRQRARRHARIADDADRIFGAGEELLDEERTARHLLAQLRQVVDRLLPAVDHGFLGDADRAVA